MSKRGNGWHLVKISVHSDWKNGEWRGSEWNMPEYPTVKHDYQLFEIKDFG